MIKLAYEHFAFDSLSKETVLCKQSLSFDFDYNCIGLLEYRLETERRCNI